MFFLTLASYNCRLRKSSIKPLGDGGAYLFALALFYLSVNVFTTKVLIGDTIFTSPNGDGTAIFRGHPSHAKV